MTLTPKGAAGLVKQQDNLVRDRARSKTLRLMNAVIAGRVKLKTPGWRHSE